MYAKTLVALWYTFYNLPETMVISPWFGALAHEILSNVLFYIVALPAILVFGSSGIQSWDIWMQFLNPDIFLDSWDISSLHHSFLSLVWHVSYADVGSAQSLLYSADHVYATKTFALWAGVLGSLSMGTDVSTTVVGTTWTNSGVPTWLDWNFSLVGTSSAFLVNVYLLCTDVCWTLLAAIDANFARSALTLTTKDFSYFILSLNSSTLWLALGFVFTTFLFMSSLVPSSTTLLSRNSWQIVFEMFYQMVLDVVDQNAGPAGRKFFPLIFTTFTLILFCNLLGMIPYSFTVTSHLIVTFSMALAIFIGINILGILKNGTHFLSLFFPPGAPLGLAPFLVLIEFVTYIFKVLSLAIRLFANLMSGHTLLKILSTFGWAAVGFWGIFIIPLVIIFLVTGLEIAIGFLQAYIFSVLLCLYIHDAIELH